MEWYEWFEQFYRIEEEKFKNWCIRAIEELSRAGLENLSYVIQWLPGVRGVVRIRGTCNGTWITKDIDTALAYSFGDDWKRFVYWFTGFKSCKTGKHYDGELTRKDEYEYKYKDRRYIDLVVAHAVAKAIAKLI